MSVARNYRRTIGGGLGYGSLVGTLVSRRALGRVRLV